MMKKTILPIALLAAVLLSGCKQQDFPGCCSVDVDNDQTRSVPFLETYLFNFKTGAGPITTANPDGNLNVISQAVLLTLLSSAQEEILPGTGVVTGTALSNGVPVKDVALKVTDVSGNLIAIRAEGRATGNDLVLPDGSLCPTLDAAVTVIDNICIKGDLFYNGLGGVPDFSNNRGTSETGSFTIFNLPPGDVYLWTFRGGRGSARIKVFEGKISVGKVQVFPIPISTVLVEGVILDAKDESTLIANAGISILGALNNLLTATSNSIGQYSITPVGTSGNHLMKVEKSGYWTSYHTLDTVPVLSTVEIPGLTRNLTLYKNGDVNDLAATKGIAANPNLGIIAGRVQFGDGTTQHCAKFSVSDAAGTDLLAAGAVVIYRAPEPDANGIDSLRAACGNPNDPAQTGTDGFYFIYNLPPGEIFLNYRSEVSTGAPGNENISSGGIITTSFPGVVFVQSLFNSGRGESQELSGSITIEDGSALANTDFSILSLKDRLYCIQDCEAGNPPNVDILLSSQTQSDGSGNYTIKKNLVAADSYPLIGGMTYRVKTSKSGLTDTYQSVSIGSAATKRDLLIAASVVPAAGKGKIYGNLINQATGRLATDVSLTITDLTGNLLQQVTTADGIFQTIDLPPGLVNLLVVSGDDSGNMIARIYPNGVTFVEFVMSKVVSAAVSVFGVLRDLDDSPVPQAGINVLGRLQGNAAPLTVDGSGNYTGELESNGRFVIQSTKTAFYDTYNFFPRAGRVDSLAPADLYAISRAQVSALAGSSGITIDNSKGIVAGKTVENSFSANLSSAGCPGGGPYKSALGFFNQDAILDIAIINCTSTNSLTIFFGNGSGNGTFVADQSYTVGTNPSDIAVGDFDGNGIADLVAVHEGIVDGDGDFTSFSILLGDKKGGFTAVNPAIPLTDANGAKPNAGNLYKDPGAVLVGLIDSDTFVDFVVTDHVQDKVIVYSGLGDGTFIPKRNANGAIDAHLVGLRPTDMVAGDFNADNRVDLAVTNRDSDSVTILLGNTEGGFPDFNTPTVGDGPEAILMVDTNADGQADLVVVNRIAQTLTILTSDVSGVFTRLVDSGGAIVPDIPIGSDSSAITWGDFNGDNRVDLAIANKAGNDVSILYGDGDGRFSKRTNEALGMTGPDEIMVLDSNLDGLHDLIVVGSDIETLLGTEKAVGGISVEARDLAGNIGGTIVYPNSVTASTSADGRFVIFNVPEDLTLVRATSGGAGNSLISSFADAVSYTKIQTLTVAPFTVSVEGKTFDPVGPAPGVPVGNVNVEVLGMSQKAKTTGDGSYAFVLDANSEFVLKLLFELP